MHPVTISTQLDPFQNPAPTDEQFKESQAPRLALEQTG
jgi:hypothetical protein